MCLFVSCAAINLLFFPWLLQTFPLFVFFLLKGVTCFDVFSLYVFPVCVSLFVFCAGFLFLLVF